jgi:hypothetical protein
MYSLWKRGQCYEPLLPKIDLLKKRVSSTDHYQWRIKKFGRRAMLAATKFDDLFSEANICRPFFRRTTNLADMATFSFYSLYPVLTPRSAQRGGHPPFYVPSALQKIFAPSQRGAMAQCPKYATDHY